MSRPYENIDAHGTRALAHPLRMAVLWALEPGPASPAEIAKSLDVSVEVVSYHVRKLSALGLIEADEPELLEGSVRHPYRLVSRPFVTEEAWDGLSFEDRDAVAFAVVHRAMRTAQAALEAGALRRTDAHAQRISLTLDEQAFSEVSEILVRMSREVIAAEQRAAKRLDQTGDHRLDATFIAMWFETPPFDSTPLVLRDLHTYRERRESESASQDRLTQQRRRDPGQP